MQNTSDGLRRATHIFEAAVWHYAVLVTCRCGHSAKFHAASLWWAVRAQGWNDSFRDATPRVYPFAIGHGMSIPLRPPVLQGVIELEMPDDREWKRAMRRFRT